MRKIRQVLEYRLSKEICAERWHCMAGSNLIPLVLAGREFEDGELKKAA